MNEPSERFQYSEEEGEQILAAVPADANPRRRARLVNTLTIVARDYVHQRHVLSVISPKAARVESRERADIVKAFVEDFQKGSVEAYFMRHPSKQKQARAAIAFIRGELLPAVTEAAKWREDHRPTRGKNRHDAIRDGFLWDLCLRWRDGLSLELKTSTVDGRAAGPLIEYLEAATAPVFKKLGEEEMTAAALRGRVRDMVKER